MDLDLSDDLDRLRTLDLRLGPPRMSHDEAVFRDSALIVPSSPGNRNVLQTSRSPLRTLTNKINSTFSEVFCGFFIAGKVFKFELQWNPLNGIPVNRFIWLMGSFF